MQGGLLLDVIVGKSTAILKLLASKDQSLLIWGNALLVLDLGLNIFDGVRSLNLKGDGFTGQGLDKNLHTSSETEDQMQSGLLLDVVVRKSTAILKLFAGKDQSLLIWGNALLVLDLCFNVLNGVRGFDLESDGFASQSFDKNLHTSTETENQMQSGFLLNVVVREGATILKLLASKDQSLLVWGNALLILNLSFDIFNGVRSLHFQSNGLAGQGLDENLHTSTETEHQVQGGLLLDVVVGEGAAILQLFSGKNQSLLVWGNSLLVLDLSLDIFDRVGGLNLKGDGLASQSLDKNLHFRF